MPYGPFFAGAGLVVALAGSARVLGWLGSMASQSPRRLTVGLTGGIGSGKSTVSQMLVALGAHLVDTDAISLADRPRWRGASTTREKPTSCRKRTFSGVRLSS